MRAFLIAVALMFPATASASLTCKSITKKLRPTFGKKGA